MITGDATTGPLLEVEGLRIASGPKGERAITTGTDLVVLPGETVGIVGESGSGKSLTARAILRLLPEGVTATGSVRYRGRELMDRSEREMRRLRGGGISLLFQDPFTMLNPLLRCGEHIAEMLTDASDARIPRDRLREETRRRLAEVGIHDPTVARRYPFQLSGGMRQRVALGSALAKDPELLIADEPSTALDVTTQAEILNLLRSVQQARGMGLILITHDLRVAFTTCHRVYVLYAGSLLEVGGADALEREPLHPYTLGLLLSEPSVEQKLGELSAIPGSVPAPDQVADRCAFSPRCRWAQEVCRASPPDLVEVEPGRSSACVRLPEIRTEMAEHRDRILGQAAAAEPVTGAPLATVGEVSKTFDLGRGRRVDALKGVSLTIGPGECVGLVGESGSGKTTLGRCLVGLETPTDGRIEIDGIDASDFARVPREDRTRLRRTVQMIFQDPYSTLNPRHTVGRTLTEALQRSGGGRRSAGAAVAELLDRVGLPEAYAPRRPAALSGGERQRVAIARALAVAPKLLVCDEPVSALDVSVQAQILNLFRRLQAELGVSSLFITHDLAVVRQVADRIYVLFKGEVVERGPADEILARPKHDYTRALMASVPGAATPAG
ncbi:MAG TPA: ABC transporter ATP-binding protein [Actinomycetota bacterium]